MTDNANTQDKTPTPDDPNLTAYALGELDPASGVYQDIASRLETDADARAFVQQVRALGEELHASYHDDARSPGLADHQHRELSAMINDQPQRKPDHASAPAPTRHIFRMPRAALLAAGLALAAGAAITTLTLLNNDPAQTHTTSPDTLITPVKGLANVAQTLSQPVAADFDNATLGEVLAYLHKQTGVAVDTNWASLKPRGLGPDTRISFKADTPQPARDVLTYALQQAWAQSPHPDPAQWSISDVGITIAPKSALVQSRLDATAKLLETRRFSQVPVDASLLRTTQAQVWDTSLWNDIRAKRIEAGQRVIDEVIASLDSAEEAAQNEDFQAASDHGFYAYRLMAINGALLQQDDFAKPLERIGKLQQAVYQGQLDQDKAAITKAVQQALANDTELTEHHAAMSVAVQALENKSLRSASDAIIKAHEALAANADAYDPEQYNEHLERAARLHSAIDHTRRMTEAQLLAQIKESQSSKNPASLAEADRLKVEAIQARLKSARQHQLNQNYAAATSEIEVALALDPDNATIKALRDMIKDSAIAVQSSQLQRTRNLSQADQSLLNIEASTPYSDILAYPGDWPEVTSMRIRGLATGKPTDTAGGYKGSLRWDANHDLPTHDDFNFRYANGRMNHPNNLGIDSTFAITPAFDLSSSLSNTSSGGKQQGQQQQQQYFSTADRVNMLRTSVEASTPASTPMPIGQLQTLNTAPNAPYKLARPAEGDNRYRPEPAPEPPLEPQMQQQMQQQQALIVQQPEPTVTRAFQLSRQREALEGLALNIQAQPEDQSITQQQIIAQRKALQEAIDRVAKNEPLELARIKSIQELGELEQRFIDESRDAMQHDPQMSRDAYAIVNDNPFYNPTDEGRAMSTFSVDVDTAAYSLVRRQLMQQGQLPVPGAVRIEEMINYFDYGYDAPVVDGKALKHGVVTQASLEQFEKDNADFAPFATHVQVTDCPWQTGNQLVRIGIKGMDVAQDERPPAHLTFLIDVSGSMSSDNKLGLVKKSLTLLLDKLNENDHVSIVTYAGSTKTVLENASAADKGRIADALEQLRSGGSTAGAAGIQLAYDAAQKHFVDGGVNRVILCTDGDFNVGIRNTDELVTLIKNKANPTPGEDGKRRGVYLSVMGYGMGNLNDAMMEPLTNAGNGTYAYIDTLEEATKVMYDQAGSTLVTIAKDVKVQVHFDPAQVMAYRLIGYENRVLANEDFADDKVDAGDIGAGHSVTALYEIVPFDDGGFWRDGEGIYEVRQQIEELDNAIALNQSVMQTCSLSQSESIKLMAATRMLHQERMLCEAAVKKAEPKADQAPAARDERPAVELDKFEDGAMMALKLRYKPVDAPAEDGTSRLITSRIFANQAVPFEQSDEATRFAAAVASYGMQLRSSPHAGQADLQWVIDTAQAATQHDPGQLRGKFINLVQQTKTLMPAQDKADAAEPAPLN